MQALRAEPRARGRVRVKTIALPAEHGGWGLLFEPIALGLLLAPSIAGVYLALSALGFFLARHPLTLLVLNRRHKSPRTALAKRFAGVYLIIGTSSFIAALVFAEHLFFIPLLMATPLAIVQVGYDWTGRRRVLLAEIAGAISISSIVAAITLAGGWSSAGAMALWAIMIARCVPAILYIRAWLERLHARRASPFPMLAGHVLAIVGVAFLLNAQLANALTVGAMGMLLIRAVVGFASVEKLTPKRLGFVEIGFGAMAVSLVAIGFAVGG